MGCDSAIFADPDDDRKSVPGLSQDRKQASEEQPPTMRHRAYMPGSGGGTLAPSLLTMPLP
jgi:hypothetical protein